MTWHALCPLRGVKGSSEGSQRMEDQRQSASRRDESKKRKKRKKRKKKEEEDAKDKEALEDIIHGIGRESKINFAGAHSCDGYFLWTNIALVSQTSRSSGWGATQAQVD